MGEEGRGRKRASKPTARYRGRRREMPLRAVLSEPPLKGIVRQTKERWTVANVVRELKQRIARKEFEAGDQLPSQVKLERLIGASRPTISKALTVLAEERLIARSGNKAFVGATANATVNLEEAEPSHKKRRAPRDKEILASRRWVEPQAAFQAALVAQVDGKFREELEAAFDDIKSGRLYDGPEAARRKDRKLHVLVFAASPNTLDQEIFAVTQGYALDALAMSLLTLWMEKEFREEIYKLNWALFESVMRGDAHGARGAAEKYVDYVTKRYWEEKGQSDRAAPLS